MRATWEALCPFCRTTLAAGERCEVCVGIVALPFSDEDALAAQLRRRVVAAPKEGSREGKRLRKAHVAVAIVLGFAVWGAAIWKAVIEINSFAPSLGWFFAWVYGGANAGGLAAWGYIQLVFRGPGPVRRYSEPVGGMHVGPPAAVGWERATVLGHEEVVVASGFIALTEDAQPMLTHAHSLGFELRTEGGVRLEVPPGRIRVSWPPMAGEVLGAAEAVTRLHAIHPDLDDALFIVGPVKSLELRAGMEVDIARDWEVRFEGDDYRDASHGKASLRGVAWIRPVTS